MKIDQMPAQTDTAERALGENTISRPIWTNKALIRLLLPLIIDQILFVLVGIIDTVMVGRLGDAAVSGVSIVDSINTLVIMLFSALTTGGAVVVSQYLGRREQGNAGECAKQLIYISIMLSVVLSALMFFGRNPILRIIYGDIGDEIFGEASVYFFFTSLTYPFIALNVAGSALFRTMGNSKVGMWVSLLINIVNFFGDAFFIFVLDMGVAGAAIATLASRVVAAVLMIWLLWRVNPAQNINSLAFSIKGIMQAKLNPVIIRNMLKIAVPNGVENAMYQFGKLALARLVTVFGTAAIAGNAIGNIFMMVGNLPGVAMSNGMVVVMGQDMGARDIPAAKRHFKQLTIWMYAVMLVYNVGILLTMPLIMGLFELTPEALAYGQLFGTIFCTADILLWIPSYGTPNALRAAGDAAFTMWIGVFSMWLIRVGMAYVFAYVFGVGPVCVWMSMCCEWFVRGIFFTVRYKKGRWQTKRVI